MKTLQIVPLRRGVSWLETLMVVVLAGLITTSAVCIVRWNVPKLNGDAQRSSLGDRMHAPLEAAPAPTASESFSVRRSRRPRRKPPEDGEVSNAAKSRTPVRRPDEPKETPRPEAEMEPTDPAAALPPEAVSMVSRILDAIQEGRAYSREHNSIVVAHFSLGSDQWNVTSGLSSTDEAVTSQTLALAPTPAPDEDEAKNGWRFLSFVGVESENPAPSFVFFPNGKVQGGVLEMGRGGNRAWLRIEADGEMFCGVLDTRTSKKSWFSAERIQQLLRSENAPAEDS